MTTRQIRITCCGMVVSTRPLPDPVTESQLNRLADDILATVDVLRSHGFGEPRVWVSEGNVAHLIGRIE